MTATCRARCNLSSATPSCAQVPHLPEIYYSDPFRRACRRSLLYWVAEPFCVDLFANSELDWCEVSFPMDKLICVFFVCFIVCVVFLVVGSQACTHAWLDLLWTMLEFFQV